MICCAARIRRYCAHVAFVMCVGVTVSCRHGCPAMADAIELTIDADMVQNMRSANETAQRFSSTDFVDLTCKVLRSTCSMIIMYVT